jgi:ubiquinone biosynthesis protein COQ9
MTPAFDQTRDLLLDAALLHVPFDGWSDATLKAAITETGTDPALARAVFPRGPVDLALAFHRRGDAQMVDWLHRADLDRMKFRERIAAAVRCRLQAIPDREAVRRAATLFALPHHAADGARAVWGTCDLIWSTLGDTSEDVNWYTKRATLAGVYSSTVLFWLGDDSPDHQATWEFLDRRIENVMQFEKLKAQVNKNPLLKPILAGPNWLLGRVRAPVKMRDTDLPGSLSPKSRG